MKYLLIVGFLIVASAPAGAQMFAMGEVGYGTYAMKSMKDFHGSIASGSGVKLEQVSNYPGYVNFGLGGGYRFDLSHTIGLNYRYMSTGARSYYSDYSGKAWVDNLVHCSVIGLFAEHKLNNSDVWPITFFLNPSLVLSKATASINYEVTGYGNEDEEVTLNGKSFSLMGCLGLQRDLPYGLFAFARAGYEYQFGGSLKLEGTKTGVKTEWSGVRVSLGVGYNFNKHNSTGDE